ncbi:MAG TPA: MFS transporter [Alphaproteobacteria bacterium]
MRTSHPGEAAAGMSSPSWIGARIDRLPATPYLWKLVILLSLGGWFELYELFFTGYIAPGLISSGVLTSTTQVFLGYTGVAAFIAATFAGLFIGTFFLGLLPDRFGRRFVFTYALLWYTAASVVMAFQTSPEGLLAWRFISGIGLGVEIVTIDAYLTELVPTGTRGRAFALNQGIMFTAVPVVALLAWWLVPQAPLGLQGWRWVVLIGALGAIAVWFIRREIPESPRWLAQSGRADEAERVMAAIEARIQTQYGKPLPPPRPAAADVQLETASLREIWKPPYRSRLLMLMVFNFAQVIGYYGFANWVPTLLIEKGIVVTKSLFYSFVIAIANPVGPLVGMSFADKVERKWVIVGSAIAIAVIGTAFSQVTAPALLIACGVAMTLVNTTLSYAYHAYQTEVFPVRVRGRAAGIAYSTSRLGAMCSGFLVSYFLQHFGVGGVFGLITAAMAVVVVSIGVFGPSVRAKSAGAV